MAQVMIESMNKTGAGIVWEHRKSQGGSTQEMMVVEVVVVAVCILTYGRSDRQEASPLLWRNNAISGSGGHFDDSLHMMMFKKESVRTNK